ncbi:hypothetical protein LCGC14_0840120 [marine sediment metagenome]|uniref:Periplasmic copper-binding protein NosD beta helix domain-containing protein n=1 Tax=marine sediment metagenome TaxID=412755 RepID=A0A0F9PI49_9ZZZZ
MKLSLPTALVIAVLAILAALGTVTVSSAPEPAIRSATQVVCAFDANETKHCSFVADGVDDDIQIQNALNVGGHILLSEGTFNISTTLDISSNTTLEMLEGGQIVSSGSGYSVFQNADYAGSVGNTDIKLVGVNVDDSAQLVDAAGRGIIDFAHVERVRIENSRLLNSHTTGISVWSGGGANRNSNISITDNYIENPRGVDNGAGISLGVTDFYVIADNLFKDIIGGSAAIGPDESTHGTITGNTGDTVRDGIVLEGTSTPPTDTLVANNNFEGNDPSQAGWGIALREGATRNVVVGNTIRNFGTGIRLMGVDENLVEGNYVSSVGLSGILLMDEGGSPSTGNIITGNFSIDNDYGIRAIGTADVNTYTDNYLARNSTANLSVVGVDNIINSNRE